MRKEAVMPGQLEVSCQKVNEQEQKRKKRGWGESKTETVDKPNPAIGRRCDVKAKENSDRNPAYLFIP